MYPEYNNYQHLSRAISLIESGKTEVYVYEGRPYSNFNCFLITNFFSEQGTRFTRIDLRKPIAGGYFDSIYNYNPDLRSIGGFGKRR